MVALDFWYLIHRDLVVYNKLFPVELDINHEVLMWLWQVSSWH
jgi:hypothetical protein